MQFRSAKIYGFGKISDRFYRFKDGLNVITGDIEERTAVIDFIYAMLYGIGGAEKGGMREKYVPTVSVNEKGRPVKYGGELVYEFDGTTYNEVCVWDANDPQNDERNTNDYYTGRIVRLVGDKPAGEQLLRLSAETFRGALLASEFPEFKYTDDGKVKIAEISACSGIDGKQKTARDSINEIESKMAKLKSSKEKKGELDRLIITKMNMQNELTRLSDTDNKIAPKRAKLDELKAREAELLANEKEHRRLLEMAKASRELIAKDRYGMLKKALATAERDLDSKIETRDEVIARRMSPLILIAGAIFILIGAAAIILQCAGTSAKNVLSYAVIACGAVIALLGIYLLAVGIYRRKTGSKGATVERLDAEIDDLKQQKAEKEAGIEECLHGRTPEEAENDWAMCGNTLKDTTDEERRYVVSRSIEDFEAELETIENDMAPVKQEADSLVGEITAMRSSANVSFGEITAATDGIDEKISELTAQYKTLELARTAMCEADGEMRGSFMPKVCAEAERIFEKVAGGKIRLTFDENYAVYAETLEKGDIGARYCGAWNIIVYMTVMIALSRNLSQKGEFYTLMPGEILNGTGEEKVSVAAQYLAEYERLSDVRDVNYHAGTQIILTAAVGSDKIFGEGVNII